MPSSERLSAAIGYAAAAIVLILLLVAVGRPLATDDAWWHLALGREFAREGPRLAGDPLLFSAVQPASSAPWLADVALAGVLDQLGFSGLRLAHVACAAAILALAAALLRREGAPSQVVNLALIAFATLAAYRLFQLKPDLASLLATLLLYAFALRPRAGPTPGRIALCAAGMGLWANLHPGFLLGPILLASALSGVVVGALVTGFAPGDLLRIRRLLLCLAAGTLATLANPTGIGAYLPYFASGSDSPELVAILDDWARLDLFSLPAAAPPPTLADWLLAWLLLLGTGTASWLAFDGWRKQRSPSVDPALVALAWAALAAMLVAVRFLWLGIFPLLLLARTAVTARHAPVSTARLCGFLAAILAAAFVWIGPWPRISDVLASGSYREPYAAAKYPVEPVWLIRDAGLEGRLFVEYWYGGYAGFWLAPKVEALINGSLNVAPAAFDAYNAIVRRRGAAGGESFLALLDRLELDLFVGTGMPQGVQTAATTAAHLERAPGWTLAFRNADSSLYLRNGSRRGANLRRVAEFYAREGIPFDPIVGFEPGRVVREHARWAIEHRLIPEHFEALEREAIEGRDPRARVEASIQSAAFYALLGLYDDALEREARIRRMNPRAVGATRRSVWCLLRAGRYDLARAEAPALSGGAQQDRLVQPTLELTRALPALSSEESAAWIARLPLLTPNQAQALGRMLKPPRARVL